MFSMSKRFFQRLYRKILICCDYKAGYFLKIMQCIKIKDFLFMYTKIKVVYIEALLFKLKIC